jgi:hypothetical protein
MRVRVTFAGTLYAEDAPAFATVTVTAPSRRFNAYGSWPGMTEPGDGLASTRTR